MKPISTVLLAGVVVCAQTASATEAAKFREKVLYAFCSQQNCTDGQIVWPSLVDVNGTLYGTTYYGGSGGGESCSAENGCGTVFAIDPKTGAETVVLDFDFSDGSGPFAGVIDVKGTLYGTTSGGGAYDRGTVFALDPKTGVVTVIHSLGNGGDGEEPVGGLIDVSGTLYGTTDRGGTGNSGTVFAIDLKTGKESVLHSFGNNKDGAGPTASLIAVNGTLYGTTYGGGAYNYGAVFALDLKNDKEKLVYSFSGEDGRNPEFGALIDVNGTLYGTTLEGGANDGGVVFAVDPGSGTETVLHSFCNGQNCSDGSGPTSTLIDVKGTLYGTTVEGGGATCGGYGCGTVFALNPETTRETVLYAFRGTGSTDGAGPFAGLINVRGTLYGTTKDGGNNASICNNFGNSYGCGTVFELTPR